MQKYGDMARESCPAMSEKVHPHLLRRGRAMHLYQHGIDLTLISQWLGHARLETTLIHAYADTEQKRRAIEQAAPARWEHLPDPEIILRVSCAIFANY